MVQRAAKLRIANSIRESIDNLKQLSQYDKPYAGYLRYLIKNSSVINGAILLINSNNTELGILGPYDFNWES